MNNLTENIRDINNRLYFNHDMLCSMIGIDNVLYQFTIISEKNKVVKNKVRYVSESETYRLIIRNNLDNIYDSVFEAFKSFKYVTLESVEVENTEDLQILELRKLHEETIQKRDNHINNLIIYLESATLI